jgi:thiol-disulfide isomerase/thioredoxin
MQGLQQVFHCRTRQISRYTVSALVISGLCVLIFLPRASDAAQNPIVEDRPAPELVGGPWFNTEQNAPIKLASRHGKVTLVEFWTLGCINCKHNLPIYNMWNKQFAGKDVTIIGVHTPETAGERVTANVVKAVKRWGITYPILVDTRGVNWNRWGQQFWPTIYLIDKQGRIRYRWEGELEYDNQDGTRKIAQLVQNLLSER